MLGALNALGSRITEISAVRLLAHCEIIETLDFFILRFTHILLICINFISIHMYMNII